MICHKNIESNKPGRKCASADLLENEELGKKGTYNFRKRLLRPKYSVFEVLGKW